MGNAYTPQGWLLNIVVQPPGRRMLGDVLVIQVQRFKILAGAIDFASLLRKLQLCLVLRAFRLADELQDQLARFVVANDAPVWIVVPDHLREMDLKCRGNLEIEEDPCVRSQAVLHKMHLHLRVHLDLVVQAYLTGLDQISLRVRLPGWKEFLHPGRLLWHRPPLRTQCVRRCD